MWDYSPTEPVSRVRRVPIVECGEPLADYIAGCPRLLVRAGRYRYRRETLLRATPARMLCDASRALPAGYRLAVVEGWRPPHIQRRMYLAAWQLFRNLHPDWSDVTLKRVVNRFTAPMNTRVPPPHSTGGAVDLMLTDDAGTVLDHRTPYKMDDPRAFSMDAPGLSSTAVEVREILATAMQSTGFTNYPSEFWHWSYGDQGWAFRGGHPNAIYGPITPEGYRPAPEDDIEAPLELLEQPI